MATHFAAQTWSRAQPDSVNASLTALEHEKPGLIRQVETE